MYRSITRRTLAKYACQYSLATNNGLYTLLVILSLVFHSSFMQFCLNSSLMQCYLVGSSYLVGSIKFRFIEFFVFDYLLSWFFWPGVTFALVAL